MAQFVVAAAEESKLDQVISQVYPDDFIKVWTGLWLVSDDATAQQVCIKLGATDGSRGKVLVASVNGYFGFAQKNVWEWLALKGTPKHGA